MPDGVYSGFMIRPEWECLGWVRQGPGTLVSDEGFKTEGFWNEEGLQGVAVREFNDGRVYKGHINEGKFHGKGTLTLADGSK